MLLLEQRGNHRWCCQPADGQCFVLSPPEPVGMRAGDDSYLFHGPMRLLLLIMPFYTARSVLYSQSALSLSHDGRLSPSNS